MKRAGVVAIWVLVLTGAMLLGAGSALAGNPCDALSPRDLKRYRALAKEGDEAARNEQWAQAIERYLEAGGICPRDPGLDFRLGRVHELRGACDAALTTYREVVKRLEAGAESALELSVARKRLVEATQVCSTGRLEARCADDGVVLSLDDGRIKLPCPFAGALQAGTLRLTAARDGFEPVVQTLVLTGGATVVVEIPALVPVLVAGDEDGSPVLGWIAGGLGLASIGTGTVLLVVASEERARIEAPRVEDGVVVSITHAEAYAAQDRAKLFDTVGVITLVAGGALLATGVVLVLVDGDEDGADFSATWTPAVGAAGGGVVLAGTF